MATNHIEPSAQLGLGTKVWHFAVILQDVIVGDECSIGSHTEIGRGTRIGDYSRIGQGCFIPSDSEIGHHVFIGPGCIFTDDRNPYVHGPDDKAYRAEPPVIEDHANIGAGCTILPGVRIGHHSLIGAGSVVSHDVIPYAVVRGDPAILRRMQPVA